MPTTYTHWRFGCDCIEVLPDELKKAINNNRELFDIGVHGPDIFFYDLTHQNIMRYGSKLHRESGRSFFEKCIEVYQNNSEDKEVMLAYIFGFLSHYALDTQCHGYVNTKAYRSPGLTHNKVEAEYDGHMMRLDSRNINQTDRAQSLRPDKFTAKIIARFFPFSEKVILRTTKGQHTVIHLLNAKGNFKRRFFDRVMRGVRVPDYADLLVYPEEHPDCRDSNLRLDKLRANALPVYKQLADNLYKALKGEEKLQDYFEMNFDPLESDDIPVLSYEEELDYKPDPIR